MAGTNGFLPFAYGTSANVLSDEAYQSALAANGQYANGVVQGQASSQQANKTWLQGTLMAAVLGQIIADIGQNANDSQSIAALEQNLIAALRRSCLVLPYDSSFANKVGGYPAKAIVADPNTTGAYWVSTADNNLTTPGASGASWVSLFAAYYTSAQSDAILAARTGRLIGVASNITPGTATWTPNPLTTHIVVEVLGGGGAGGGTDPTSSSQQAVAWGGTGGMYAKSGPVPLSRISTPVTVTVGAGGAGAAGADGNPGLTSSFGSYLTAPGGQGGYKGYANPVGQSIGADMPVSPDGSGSILILSQRGSGGGGPLALGSQITTRGGYGGRSFLGPGGGGTTGAGSSPNVGYLGGGGGGQAVGPGANSALPGATGGNGCVVIWEYA